MTDMELAEEVRWRAQKLRDYASSTEYPSGPFCIDTAHYMDQIIAALRRGPLEEWSQQVRLIVRGIDGQAERITKREQTTWRDGENQAPDEDSDFEDVVIGYKLNTGLWHRLLGLLASCPANERPPSGEMVIVPRQSVGALDFLLTRIGSWTTARWDQHLRHEFGDERAEVQIQDLKAMLSAAEAEVRRPCPLCGRTDPHSHTSGPLGMS